MNRLTSVTSPIKIKRALISVYDKNGIIDLAQELNTQGVEIFCSSGTKSALNGVGISAKDIQEITGEEPAFDGRVKTISFGIAAGLLYDRQSHAHQQEALRRNIVAIDLLVCNLYALDINNIDIGGVTLIRAGGKNFQGVAVLTDPSDYVPFISELQKNQGEISLETRKYLMRKAFNYTADYDSNIAMSLDENAGIHSLRYSFHNGEELRYGENPHQQAKFYHKTPSSPKIEVLFGTKELSYNNILDINAAKDLLFKLKYSQNTDEQKIIATIIKHGNPCGAAAAQGFQVFNDKQENQVIEVLRQAFSGDPVSAFGGILATNWPITLEIFKSIEKNFLEAIIAPSIDEMLLHYLSGLKSGHKNLRLIKYNEYNESDEYNEHNKHNHRKQEYEGKISAEGALLQAIPPLSKQKYYEDIRLVTGLANNGIVGNRVNINRDLVEFGLKIVSEAKSNAIVIVREQTGNFQMVGHGQGQTNRVTAVDNAIKMFTLKTNSENATSKKTTNANVVLISDGFFPFADNIEIAAEAGIKNIVQPGGSIRDQEVIAKCNQLGINMYFTGIRLFKH
ncbi:MAG: bifunctional phosphoribosylaminoimidazolecarboxamide formyltransferase/IMP cyclohydrolase [Oligoflexia bacterium]|nr:bifunctional phosphoribosylaminoimidazolecarboxamide formyltransferase/IMP cyclohydrolase [Oligoflexia bacterium]